MFQVCQFRVSLEKDAKKQEQMWESQQKQATDKIYFVCSDLGGFVTLVSSSLANGVLLLVKTRSKPSYSKPNQIPKKLIK